MLGDCGSEQMCVMDHRERRMGIKLPVPQSDALAFVALGRRWTGRKPTRSCHSTQRVLAYLLDKSSTRADRGTAFETALRLTSKNLPGTGGHDMRISSIFFSPRAACLAAARR